MEGWAGVYLKQPVLEPELYNMRSNIEEKHEVAAAHADIVQRMLQMAEQCRAEVGDTTLNCKGAGVREPGE